MFNVPKKGKAKNKNWIKILRYSRHLKRTIEAPEQFEICSKLTIKTPERRHSKLTIKTPERRH